MKPAYYYLILLILVLSLYGNTLRHGFVLDDTVVLSQNTFVKKGIPGIGDIFSNDTFAGFERVGEGQTLLKGGRYRPLSLALFAILYSFFGLNPVIFHGLAIVLYAGLVLMLYHSLKYVLQATNRGQWIAFIAALIFAVHPVHTEVVANIKSCDETLALLFGMLSVYSLFRAFDSKRKVWLIGSGISFLGACFSKENAITFLLLAPLAVWFFRKSKWPDMYKLCWPLAVGAVCFLSIRGFILDHAEPLQMMADPLNDPFLKWNGETWISFTGTEKLATILFAFWEYIRLLVFPYPLTHDYYPFTIDVQHFGKPMVWAGLIAFSGMAGYALLEFRKRTLNGYSILFYLISLSLTLNVLFPVGTFMAERFLFIPSVGFCLLAAGLSGRYWNDTSKNISRILIALVVVIFSILTFQRNKVWRINDTLIAADINVSEKSVKLQNDLGTILLTNALSIQDATERQNQMVKAASHLKRALDLHPTYYDAYLAYGAAAYYAGQYDQSVWSYSKAYELSPEDQKSIMGLFYALQGFANDEGEKGNTALAVEALSKAYEIQQDSLILKQIEKYRAK